MKATYAKQVAGDGGCRVVVDVRSDWQVRVLPGMIELPDGSTATVGEEHTLAIRPGGRRSYRNQRYAIVGEATQSPTFWNGEDIRGSGGMPYQRMVPGTLRVYNDDRTVCYKQGEDYCNDYYWGTIKRHPEGSIQEKEVLLLDYEAWLCRYDAIVLLPDGTLAVVEGLEEALESRELLLPDPPTVRDGIVLAHVFTGWGEASLHDGSVTVELDSSAANDSLVLSIEGKYLDSTPRTYWVEVVAVSPADGTVSISIAAEGTDYGMEERLTSGSLRWAAPVTVARQQSVPLAIQSGYGHAVEWGVSIRFDAFEPDAELIGKRVRITAKPRSVMAFPRSRTEALAVIPVRDREALEPFRMKLSANLPVRIAFYGESTTRTGHWPYYLLNALRSSHPEALVYSSNVAIGGESSVRGIHRYEHEVRSVEPDLVVLEYMLNDTGAPNGSAEHAMRGILGMLREDGIPCLVVTNNGMNPLFCGSMRSVEAVHDLYRRLAEEFGCAFVGGFDYFNRLDEFGLYYMTELKGNMVNHPYGNVDPGWGDFDVRLGEAVIKAVAP